MIYPIRYYSLNDGSYSPNEMFCTSGFIFNNICQKGPNILDKKIPYRCSITDDSVELCNYTYPNGDIFSLDCQCGVNSNGQGYCPLAQGDSEYVNYINSLKKLLNNPCHTTARMDPKGCDWLSTKNIKYLTAKVKSYTYKNHYLLQGNEICIKETVLYDYYHMQSDSKHLNAVSYVFLILLILII